VFSGDTFKRFLCTLGAAPTTGNTASGPTTFLGSVLKAVIPTVIPASGANLGSGITISNSGTYLFNFNIIIAGTTNPSVAYIIPGGLITTFGFSIVNGQNISIIGSYVLANVSGNIGLQIEYSGGSGLSINSTSFFTAVRIA
jgi:hypothetical protein